MSSVDVHLGAPAPGRRWLVPALGVTLAGAGLAYFGTHGVPGPMVAVATILPALALLGYGLWFWLRAPAGARGDAVFAWAIGGAGVVITLDLWAVLVGTYGSTTTVTHVVIQHTSTGALGAAIAGTYSERDRWRAGSHLRLLRALDAAMDGIAVLDDAGNVSFANAAFAEGYGVDSPGGVVGDPWQVCYPEATRERVAAVLAELDAGEREEWQGTVTARRVDGTTYPQDLSMTALAGDGYVWVCRDVTGREERDQRLRVLNRVLRHNVRNALNLVLGRAERLRERHGDDEDIESIVAAAENLLAAGEKARLLERALEAGVAPADRLGEIVTEEVERAADQYPDVSFETTVSCELEADSRLRLAVRELLSNAAEHNDAADPTVHVTVEAGPPTVRVADNGSGIPENERRALGGVEETPLRHGSGVGLWLVYWLVTQSDGTVGVTDEGNVVVRPDAEPVKSPEGAGKN
ncbi:ATP-binding protein [Halobacterium wangiae]|uniref:ATP-binding protein n=1 Tax=Halobacterium wangiae TaxID=2902623 RepID=UPI001E525E0E|nr:ATP-binding protein [Halobacterium wangiae]